MTGDQFSVIGHAHADVVLGGILVVAVEIFLAARCDFDRTARLHGDGRCDRNDRIDLDRRAECAAERKFLDVDLAKRHLQSMSQKLACSVNGLDRAPDGERTVYFGLCDRALGLHLCMIDALQGKILLKHAVCPLESALDIALINVADDTDVVLYLDFICIQIDFVIELRRSVCQSVLRVIDGRKLFVLDFDGAQRFVCKLFRVSCNGGNGLADVAAFARKNRTVAICAGRR